MECHQRKYKKRGCKNAQRMRLLGTKEGIVDINTGNLGLGPWATRMSGFMHNVVHVVDRLEDDMSLERCFRWIELELQ